MPWNFFCQVILLPLISISGSLWIWVKWRQTFCQCIIHIIWSPTTNAVLPRRNLPSLVFTGRISFSLLVFWALARISYQVQPQVVKLYFFIWHLQTFPNSSHKQLQRLLSLRARYSHSKNLTSQVPSTIGVTFLMGKIAWCPKLRESFVSLQVCRSFSHSQLALRQNGMVDKYCRGKVVHGRQKVAKQARGILKASFSPFYVVSRIPGLQQCQTNQRTDVVITHCQSQHHTL